MSTAVVAVPESKSAVVPVTAGDGQRKLVKKPPKKPFLFLTYNHLKEDHCRDLSQLSSPQDIRAFLRKLNIVAVDEKRPGESRRADILIELLQDVVSFAIEQKMAADKMSAVFSIVWVTHTSCCEKPESPPSMERSYRFFENLLLQHSVHRPPWGVAVFSLQDVKAITEFVVNKYFRFFKLYQYVFVTHCELDLQPSLGAASSIPVGTLLPLSQAVSETALDGQPSQPPQPAAPQQSAQPAAN